MAPIRGPSLFDILRHLFHVMMVMMVVMVLGACDRRCGDGDDEQGGQNVGNLLHFSLLEVK
jgi:hypothetical protein